MYIYRRRLFAMYCTVKFTSIKILILYLYSLYFIILLTNMFLLAVEKYFKIIYTIKHKHITQYFHKPFTKFNQFKFIWTRFIFATCLGFLFSYFLSLIRCDRRGVCKHLTLVCKNMAKYKPASAAKGCTTRVFVCQYF